MENLLLFIFKMINTRVVHCDIKDKNIVTGINGEQFRFIDFGISINLNNFVYNYIFSKPYKFFLPTTIFLSDTPEKITDEIIEKYCIEFYKKTEFNKFLNMYLKKYGIDEYNLKKILIDVREKIKAGESLFKILKLIDLYSFTTVLDNYLYKHFLDITLIV